MPKVEGVRWEDLDDAVAEIFSHEKTAAAERTSPLDSFDFDGSLGLVARLQKAAAAAEEQDDKKDLAPPFKKDDDESDEGEDKPSPFKKKDDDDDEAEKVAAAAVMRQTIADVCSILAGGETGLDKTAGVVALGLLEGHSGSDVGAFVSGMDKTALQLPHINTPWTDLPEQGLLTNVRRTFHRTPEEKLLQSEGNFARSQAAAERSAAQLSMKNKALNLERAAKHAPGDALHRSSQIQGLMAGGLDRPAAERLLAEQADEAGRKAMATARKGMGLDRGKVPVSFGNISTSVNKRLFSKTAPLALAALGGGYMLGRGRDRDRDRPRGLTIS